MLTIEDLRVGFNQALKSQDFEPDPWNKVACRKYARGNQVYAVCIVNVQGKLYWQGYRLITNIDGPATARFWQKIPSNTSAEEKRFPKHLARLGQEFLEEYKKEQENGLK